MTNFINSLWFGNNKLDYLFLPFSLIYYLITVIRRYLYKIGLFKSYRSSKTIVVVGNIMIGGNGKTPLVIALVNHLKAKGLRVAVVSRGYGAKPKSYPYLVTKDSPVYESGDEPKLIAIKTGVNVYIDPVRSRAIKAAEQDADVIISDDGLQHYAFKRDIEIIVQDGKRMCGNGFVLPAGPLRETKSRLNEADFVVLNGGVRDLNKNIFTLNPEVFYDLSSKNKPQAISLDAIRISKSTDVAAFAGIGDPNRFYKTLSTIGFKVVKTIDVADHKAVEIEDILKTSKEYTVFMTEKDMVKYSSCDLPNCYALSVKANFLDGFLDEVTEKVLYFNSVHTNKQKRES